MFAFLDELVPRGKKYGEREHHLKIGWFIFDAKNVVDKIFTLCSPTNIGKGWCIKFGTGLNNMF